MFLHRSERYPQSFRASPKTSGIAATHKVVFRPNKAISCKDGPLLKPSRARERPRAFDTEYIGVSLLSSLDMTQA